MWGPPSPCSSTPTSLDFAMHSAMQSTLPYECSGLPLVKYCLSLPESRNFPPSHRAGSSQGVKTQCSQMA